MLDSASGALPVLSNVTVCAGLVVAVLRAANVSDAGLTPATGAGRTPVPDSATSCTLPGAALLLSVNRRIAERAPAAVGRNVSATVHDCPVVSVLVAVQGPPAAPAGRTNSAAFVPVIARPVSTSGC